MGYEGFSRPLALPRMAPIYGNKFEYIILILLIGLYPVVNNGRKKNEAALREQIKTNNCYAELKVCNKCRQPSHMDWTLTDPSADDSTFWFYLKEY